MARSVGVSLPQVIAVAAEFADTHGFDRLTLAMVAERLGVRLPSLYNHVDGLPGLRQALALHGLTQLLVQMRGAAVGLAGDPAVVAVALAYRAYVLAHPGLYSATLRAPAADATALTAVASELLDVLRAVLRPYDLDAEGLLHAVRGLRALVHGFTTLELAGGFGLPLAHEASFGWLIQAYLAALRGSGEPEGHHHEET